MLDRFPRQTLDKHKLIYECQSGFRRNHSCQTSLTKMVDNWFTTMNNNEIVGAVLLDLSKAFDLVNHQILKQKLSVYKFSQLSQRWFDSYLSNRFQQVQISGKLSQSKEIKAGVPQGSSLGPYYSYYTLMTCLCTSNIAFWIYLQMMEPYTLQMPIFLQ